MKTGRGFLRAMGGTIVWFALCVLALTHASADTEPQASDAKSLSGWWVMAQLMTTVTKIPILGNVYASTRMVSLLRLRHEAERLHGDGVLCHFAIDSGSRFVRTSLSPDAVARLPAPVVDARVQRERGRWLLKQPRQVVVVGARLEDVRAEALPTDPSDARVHDEDGDGQPGMTVSVSGLVSGMLFVAQRSWTELAGTLEPERDLFVGSLHFDNEQVILGTTSPRLLRRQGARPVPERSWFRMQRVSSTTGCGGARHIAEGWP